MLRSLRHHENLLQLYDIIPPKQSEFNKFNAFSVIIENSAADLGTIFRTNQFFRALYVQHILYQILCGVQYMHSMNIAHRDLKPANITIDEYCNIKITGFYKACFIDPDNNESFKYKEQKQIAQKKLKKELLEIKESIDRGIYDKDITLDEWRKLEEAKNRKKVKRVICRHVITRWYRSPEEILWISSPANSAMGDIWGIGAIFAELLQMQRENRPDPTKRGPIFPGDHECFPKFIRDPMDYASPGDQMQVMIDIIGTPDESELDKINDEKARKYLRSLTWRKKKNLKRMFPGADRHTLDLMTQLLKFDIDERISIKDAMNHKYFDHYRFKTDKELNAFRKGCWNPLSFHDEELSMNEYRTLILGEILMFDKDEVIVHGYIRIYIEPLLGIIPLDVVNLLCAVFGVML